MNAQQKIAALSTQYMNYQKNGVGKKPGQLPPSWAYSTMRDAFKDAFATKRNITSTQ
jgi:hypothetical protein